MKIKANILIISLSFLFSTAFTKSMLNIVVLDMTGSFIGKYAPPQLKEGALQKISEIIDAMNPNDTLLVLPLRENANFACMRQIIYVKPAKRQIYDNTAQINNALIQQFGQALRKELSIPAAGYTDLVGTINYAADIAVTEKPATLWVFSDGQDNIKNLMFHTLTGVSVRHLFIWATNQRTQAVLVDKWQRLYAHLGAASVICEDAQASLTYRIGGTQDQ